MIAITEIFFCEMGMDYSFLLFNNSTNSNPTVGGVGGGGGSGGAVVTTPCYLL
jgi:hypothetical protein